MEFVWLFVSALRVRNFMALDGIAAYNVVNINTCHILVRSPVWQLVTKQLVVKLAPTLF